MSLLRQLSVLIACIAGTWAPMAGAGPKDGWPTLTLADLEAARRILLEDHPETARELAVTGFRDTLDTAYRVAQQRARQVSSYDGYRATIAGFPVAMGDAHIWSRALYRSDTVEWTGIIIGKRGERYVVVTDERDGQSGGTGLQGTTLVACDGVAAAAFAAEKLGGFRAVWRVDAQRIQAAPFLLIDDGNPFVRKPTGCTFERDGQVIDASLTWRPLARSDLRARIRPALNYGEAGYGVRNFSGGSWISLQGLEFEARAVVDAAEREAASLRAAPIVVLDMRGNGGGSSSFGRELADILFGAARVAAVLGPVGGEATCPESVWRVSPRNLARLRQYLVLLGADKQLGPLVRDMVDRVETALAEGRTFSGPTQCSARDATPVADIPPAVSRGRIVLLTDSACFSSCLLVVDQFRRLGALHVGGATNANTHFSEAREDTLPSGLATFSTLQAFEPKMPRLIGPYEPQLRYDGDFKDTAALEAWIVASVSK